jgi:hypothetical protein
MKDLRNLEGLALSYQPHLLDILFDRMPMGIAILDQELRVQRFNPTWADCVARYSPGSAGRVVPGVSLLELTPGNEAAVRALFEPVLCGQLVERRELPTPPMAPTITVFSWAEVALFSVINWPCFQLTKTREVNAIRKAVQITGDANLSGAILLSNYDLRLPYAKG